MLERLKNFGWLGAEESVRLVLGFALTLLLANHLGSGQYGAYGYLFGFVTLFTPLIAFGLDPLIARQSVEQPERLGAILQVALVLRICGALLAFALAMGLMVLLPTPEGTSLTLAAIAGISILAMPGNTPNTIFKALEKARLVAIPRLLVTAVATSVAIAFVIQDRPLADFVWIRAIEAVVLGASALAMFLILRPNGVSLAPAFDPGLARQFLRNGFPLMLSGLASLIYMRIDQVMIGQLSGVDELGKYTVAVRFSDAALFVPVALQAAFFPALVRAQKRDEDAYRKELRHFFDMMSLALWALVACVILGGSVVIVWLLNPVYADSAAMLAVLALGIPLMGLGVARSSHLTIRGWFWSSTIMTAAGAAANIAFNFLLIPGYGGMGAAVASIFAYWLAGHGMCYVLPWTRDLGRDMLRAMNPFGAGLRLAAAYRNSPRKGSLDAG